MKYLCTSGTTSLIDSRLFQDTQLTACLGLLVLAVGIDLLDAFTTIEIINARCVSLNRHLPKLQQLFLRLFKHGLQGSVVDLPRVRAVVPHQLQIQNTEEYRCEQRTLSRKRGSLPSLLVFKLSVGVLHAFVPGGEISLFA